MRRNWVAGLLIFALLLLNGFSSASASSPPAKIISNAASTVISALVKWLWSLQSASKREKTDVSSRSMMKFEGGYSVETVFDGSRVGIEPYSIDVSQDGELLVLDSDNSNIYKIRIPLSRNSRPKLVAGSPEGYRGHVDGWAREARLNHPRGLAVDDRGNIYIADTMNMAIRKISDSGISTIAGGKWSRSGGGHVDGPSVDAKFSNDFDVFYVRISCSLLVVDRGNQAIREIQLHRDDCSRSHEDEDGGNNNIFLGVAVLVAAGFFGYMLALLQQRVRAIFSNRDDLRAPIVKKTRSTISPYYQTQPKPVRPPLIPPTEETEPEDIDDDGIIYSAAKLIINTGSSMAEIIAGLFMSSSTRTKKRRQYYQNQETFLIPDEDGPPPLDPQARAPPLKRSYPFMAYSEMERSGGPGQIHGPNGGSWAGDYRRSRPEPHQQHSSGQHGQQYYHRHISSNPETHLEKSCETNEVVFGAVQEQDGRREGMVIKAVDYGDPMYNHHNIRPRINYTGHDSNVF